MICRQKKEEIQETLSLLSEESHEHQSTRVNNRVDNSPTLISATNQRAPESSVVESNQEQTVGTQPLPLAASPSNENATGSGPTFVTVQNSVPPQTENTTGTARLSLTTTESLNHPTNTFGGLPGQLPRFPGQTSLTATISADTGLFLNNASTLQHPSPSVSFASASTIAQPRPNPIVTLPVNHILPNQPGIFRFPSSSNNQQSPPL